MPQPTAQQQFRRIRQSLAALERAANRLVASLNGRPARKLQLSPKRRAQLKLHGSYLGYIRQLKPKERAKVKAVKLKKGYLAAIAMARRLAPAATLTVAGRRG